MRFILSLEFVADEATAREWATSVAPLVSVSTAEAFDARVMIIEHAHAVPTTPSVHSPEGVMVTTRLMIERVGPAHPKLPATDPLPRVVLTAIVADGAHWVAMDGTDGPRVLVALYAGTHEEAADQVVEALRLYLDEGEASHRRDRMLVERDAALVLLPPLFEAMRRLWTSQFEHQWRDPVTRLEIRASMDQIGIELRLDEPRGEILGSQLRTLYRSLIGSETGQKLLDAAGTPPGARR
ncbi:MAG: hypothetical protein AAGA90_07890 [Actinomycetota bacterium]